MMMRHDEASLKLIRHQDEGFRCAGALRDAGRPKSRSGVPDSGPRKNHIWPESAQNGSVCRDIQCKLIGALPRTFWTASQPPEVPKTGKNSKNLCGMAPLCKFAICLSVLSHLSHHVSHHCHMAARVIGSYISAAPLGS